MAGLTDAIRSFLAAQPVGVVGTERPDGTTRQSLVYYVLDGDRVLASTEARRAKARDVERTGRASMCVMAHEKPFPSVTVEGPARIITEGVGEPTTRIMGVIAGAPLDQPIPASALAAAGRVILEITIDRVYGVSHLTVD